MIGAAIGAILGGMANGVITNYQTKKLAEAHKRYAKDIRNAAEQYSGHNADVAMTEKGNQQGQMSTKMALDSNANKPQTGNLAMANAQNAIDQNSYTAQNAMQQGQNLGRSLKSNDLNAAYNVATEDARQDLDKAQKDYQLGQAATQLGTNTLSGVSGLASMFSDENVKEGYHNKQGIPEADAEDALRQIESIEYQYKPETGLDDDKHVGVTAQSLQGTAFDDVVQKDGEYLALDKQKLLESVMAGCAALQKEIDGLSSKDMVSDERCKQAENFIENNPEEAAASLSGPLKKEAEQVLDGDERTSEVNDEVLEKHIGDFLKYGKKERRKSGEAKQTKQNALDELDMISTEDMRAISEMGGTDNPYSPAVTNGESYGDDYKALAPTSGLDLDLTGIEDLPAVIDGPVEEYNFDWAYEVLPDEQKEEFEQVPDEQKEEWLKLHDITPPEGFYGSGVSGGGATNTSSLDLDLTSEVPTTETTPTTSSSTSSGSTTAATVSGDTNSEISNTTGNVTAKGTPNIIGSAEDNYGAKNVPGNNTSGNTTSNGATSSSATEKTGTLKAPKPSKLPDGESNNQVENDIDLSEASIENIRNRVAQLDEDVAIQNGFENDSFNGVPLSQLEGSGINEAMKVLDTLGV